MRQAVLVARPELLRHLSQVSCLTLGEGTSLRIQSTGQHLFLAHRSCTPSQGRPLKFFTWNTKPQHLQGFLSNKTPSWSEKTKWSHPPRPITGL